MKKAYFEVITKLLKTCFLAFKTLLFPYFLRYISELVSDFISGHIRVYIIKNNQIFCSDFMKVCSLQFYVTYKTAGCHV